MERFSFKSGRAMRIAKLTKQDWPIVVNYTNACKEAAREAYESNPEKKKEAARKI